MRYSLNSLKGFKEGSIIGLIKGILCGGTTAHIRVNRDPEGPQTKHYSIWGPFWCPSFMTKDLWVSWIYPLAGR